MSLRARFSDRVTVGVFLAAIALPLVMTSTANWDAAAERRVAAPLPEAGLLAADPEAYTAAVGDFFDDHFGLRRPLIDLRNLIDVFVFRSSPTPLVVMGKDGWLFFAGDGSMDDYAGKRTVSPAAVEAWRDKVGRRRDWLAARGIKYVLAIAPNKQTVYPELLPGRAGVSRAAQLAQSIAGSDLAANVVFLSAALTADKARGDLYQHLDSHWNPRGAYIGFRAIMDRAAQLPGKDLSPVRFPWDAFTPAPEQDRDLARMMGVPMSASGGVDTEKTAMPCITVADFEGIDSLPRDELVRMDAARTCATGVGRVILFHDSFGAAIWRYFAGSFARLRTSSRHTSDAELERYVALEQPDLVVELWVERTLDPGR